MNMLSAKKVRIHGMSSTRWTTRDKILQYKGLITLYTRDRKVLLGDNAVARKKLVKELKQVRKEIQEHWNDLYNAVQGDRQKLRTTLQNNRLLQITFQESHPLKVIDYLFQGNFNKRKFLDRVQYRMKQKMQRLIDLKLELGNMEDQITLQNMGTTIPGEDKCQLITGKVQDAYLKKEAALACQHTYNNILSILKKDSAYFDSVLHSLKTDGLTQSKCILRTTELGQLATEYLDDRRLEFKELERAVKRDMKTREHSLKMVREEVDALVENMSLLIRKDSDINLGKVILPSTNADLSVQRDVEQIQNILGILKETVCVSTVENIYPCLENQQRQSLRLYELLQKCQQTKDIMEKKKEHGSRMHENLMFSMPITTLGYKADKQRILDEMEHQQKRKNDLHQRNILQNELLVAIRSSAQQLLLKCNIVTPPREKPDNKSKTLQLWTKPDTMPRQSVKRSTSSIVIPPDVIEEQGIDILAKLNGKLQILMNNVLPPLDKQKAEEALKAYQQLAADAYPQIQYEQFDADESLIAGLAIEDPQVPSYNEVKAKSKELVELCNIDEDLIPAAPPKKKKPKFK